MIEIKTNRGPTREAIQELYKYASLIRLKFLTKFSEFRLILLSVDWHDLLVPFSDFFRSTEYEVIAGKIILDRAGLVNVIEKIDILPTSSERAIGRRHFIWHFSSIERAEEASFLVASHMNACGLVDFILIIATVKSPENFGSASIYFAQNLLSFDDYDKLIRQNGSASDVEEFENSIDGLVEEEDRLNEASDNVWLPRYDDLFPKLKTIGSEISHPEKASQRFNENVCDIVKIFRYGRFSDSNISDEIIISEIIGAKSESDYQLSYYALYRSRPEIERLERGIKNIFFFNQNWRGQCKDVIDYGMRKSAIAIDFKAFSNEDILLSIATTAIGRYTYTAAFSITLTHFDNETEVFFGGICWTGIRSDLENILLKHFGSDKFEYFIQRHFGRHRNINQELMDDLGLQYIMFQQSEGEIYPVRVQGSVIQKSRRKLKFLPDFAAENSDFIRQLISFFLNHDGSFTKIYEDAITENLQTEAEEVLKNLIVSYPKPTEEIYWSGDVDYCDLCHASIAERKYMVDAIFPRGMGANLCPLCFMINGRGIGLGYGQIFSRIENRWLCSAGTEQLTVPIENWDSK